MLSKISFVTSLLVATFGTGILFAPASFKLLGYAYAIVAVVFIGILTHFSIYFLASCAVVSGQGENSSYSSLASAFSKKLKIVLDVTLVLSNLTMITASLRFFCSNAALLLNSFGVPGDGILLQRVALCFILFTATYFGTKSSLKSLSIVSQMSLIGVFYYIYICLISYYSLANGQHISDLSAVENGHIVPGFIKLVFAMHCQFAFPPLFSQVEEKRHAGAWSLCALSSLVIACFYAIAGIVGYKAIGNEIGERHTLEIFADRKSAFMRNILENTFDKNGILPAVAVLFFLFVWFGSIVFMSHPVITIMLSYYGRHGKFINRKFVSILLSFFLLCVGYPASLNVGLFIDMGAALFTAPIGFGYPSLLMIFISEKYSFNAIFSYFLIILTFLLALYIIITAALGL